MKTAMYKGMIVLLVCKSTKNCRIARDINNIKATELVPTVDLTFPAESGAFLPTLKATPKTVTYADLHEDFVTVAANLSPENLSCDGEASATYIRRRRRELQMMWAELEKKLGRTVTEDEVWNYQIASTDRTNEFEAQYS